MKRTYWLAAVLAFLLAAFGSAETAAASTRSSTRTIVAFDPDAGQLPEGVAVDNVGNVFVSLSPLGQLVRVAPGAQAAEPFGAVSGLLEGDIGLIGLAVDAPGNVYGAVMSMNPQARGVWRFDRRTGSEVRVPGTENMVFPNSIAFDRRGTMYITDIVLGAVWRVRPGGVAESWLVHPLLAGDGSGGFGVPLGANGIAVRQGVVYVGVTETALLVTIPVLKGGAPGEPAVYAELPLEYSVDGIALDVHGGVYVAAPGVNAVVRVNRDGSVDTLATAADGLDAPTSVAFGTGKGHRQSLFAVNFSIAIAPPGGAGPSLVEIPVRIPGCPCQAGSRS
ncbi:MAG: SMP-30/gluconolactonase/LRE family protein [Acidimicrobiales bacterium]